MQTIDLQDCRISPDVLERLRRGESIAITEDGNVVAVVLPADSVEPSRPFGLCRGEFSVPANFNDPDPDLEALFYGRDGA